MKHLFPLLIAVIFISGCAHRAASPPPPVATDATEVKFNEFFVSPVGPRGLALTEKLAGLDGKRVRMTGYMVEQHGGPSGKFILAPMPLQLHDHDSALADDLPAAVVHVTVPTCVGREVPFVPGPMALTGVLAIGHREEADGRMSLVRLELDPPKNFIDQRRHH